MHSLPNTVNIGYKCGPRRHLSQGLHVCPNAGLRYGVKIAKCSHHIIRGADGRGLKECSTGPTKSPFLKKGGDPGDDSIREDIRVTN